MDVTILALGSRGDVLPYATLGKGLKAAGHQVCIATFENFEPMINGIGLSFHPVQGDARSILNSSSGLSLSESGQNPIRFWRSVMQSFGTLAQGYARDFSSPALWESDLIINQLPGGLYGYDLAEKLDIPMIMAAVIPLNRTRAFPMLGFPSRLAPIPGYNAISYRIAEQLVWGGFRRTVNRWRQETLGLSKQSFWGYFGQIQKHGVPVLNGFSAQVVPRPSDWGEHIHITGYWFPEGADWQPPDNLRKFIEVGPPPVFIGFGSMPLRDPERTVKIILEALKRTGQRGILQVGWAGIGNGEFPENIFQIDYVPYAWLFPRMAAIVHHGGSGTTAFGLRAGVPSIIIPFLFDQYFWGKRIHELGVGPQPIRYRNLSTDRLADAIIVAISDSQMQKRAKSLGKRIRQENGIASAVDIIQQYLHP